MISIDNVAKAYGEARVVDDVSLDLPDSGVTSVIGANGAGKSTLLAIVARLLGADAGVVRVDGLDVAHAPSVEVARRMSVLRQDPRVTARLSVGEYVEFGRFPHSRGRIDDSGRRAVAEALEFCDLTQVVSRPLEQLSGGQRQRAHLAMVLAQDTRYVLLDEPLNNLDMVHATSTMKLLRRLADERGKSIVVVLHDVNYAAAYSDRIIAMRDGRVVHDGPPKKVITATALHDVYDMRVKVHQVDGDRVVAYYR